MKYSYSISKKCNAVLWNKKQQQWNKRDWKNAVELDEKKWGEQKENQWMDLINIE